MTIIAASIPVLRALLSASSPSKTGSSALTSPPISAASRGWRDYEAIGEDSSVKMTTLKPYVEPSSRAVNAPSGWKPEW